MNVDLVSITKPEIKEIKNPEDLVAFCARVSNPSNQMNIETAPKLLKFLIKHKHWSPFELVDMCVEIKTSRGYISIGIARQIAVSIIISRYGFSLDIGPFYLVVEF